MPGLPQLPQLPLMTPAAFIIYLYVAPWNATPTTISIITSYKGRCHSASITLLRANQLNSELPNYWVTELPNLVSSACLQLCHYYPKMSKMQIFYQKHLVLMGILKNPRDRIREFIFKKLCQEDFAIGPLFKVDLGKKFFWKKQFFAFY